MTDNGGYRVLDLFCGAGGSAMGWLCAGATEIIGIDSASQPHYPFTFYRMDWRDGLHHFADRVDVIHASPPCQHFSDLAHRNGNRDNWPNLIPEVRAELRFIDKPYVIENVEGCPLLDPITLCGTMFPGLRVIRHRLFESNIPLTAPEHGPHPLVFTYDKRKAHYGKLDQDTAFVTVTGGGNARVANKRAAMGCEWMTGAEVNEAIPPAYTEWIGRQVFANVSLRRQLLRRWQRDRDGE